MGIEQVSIPKLINQIFPFICPTIAVVLQNNVSEKQMLPWIIWISCSPDRVEGKTKLAITKYKPDKTLFFVIT